MTRRVSRRSVLEWGAVTTGAGLAGCLDAVVPPSPSEQVREHEDALEQFSDVSTAIERGYRTTGTYLRNENGVLGVPFVNNQAAELDPEQPQAVLFDLTDDGQYEPIGLKWFVPTEGRDGPPSLFGREFSGPYEEETPFIPRHYALHVWLFRENPDGLFSRYNAAIETVTLVEQVEPVRSGLADLLTGGDAEENGYRNTETCIAMDDGGYGVPFVRENGDGQGGTDPEDPPVLLYRLTQNWSYRLLGAEWYVPASDVDGPPSLFDQSFHEAMDGHSTETDQPEHYGLHGWFFQANPRGMFAPLNPTVSC